MLLAPQLAIVRPVIEINPDDKDGNKDLADLLKEAIEDATDLTDGKDEIRLFLKNKKSRF